jgi:hypothetical protein
MNFIRVMNGDFARRLVTPARAVALVLASAALGACVVQPVGYGGRPYYGGGAYVTVAPPAPQVEVVSVAPVPGYIWLSGYWGWNGGRHEWVPGRWEAPRPGYRYEPHHWEREGGGWRLHEGRWAEDRGGHEEREHHDEHERRY